MCRSTAVEGRRGRVKGPACAVLLGGFLRDRGSVAVARCAPPKVTVCPCAIKRAGGSPMALDGTFEVELRRGAGRGADRCTTVMYWVHSW